MRETRVVNKQRKITSLNELSYKDYLMVIIGIVLFVLILTVIN